MFVVKFWNDLSAYAKAGFVAGLLAIVATVVGGAYWLLQSDFEVVIKSSSPERIAAAVREIERQKIPYQVSADGTSVEVPRAQLGRVRVSVAQGGAGASNGVGFELFNNTDFSTTEFTQKINYQRALQGELARTVSSIEGVASARVHLVLPDSSFLRRQTVRPTAAVTVFMEGGTQLNANQVQGIQKLVAASVPEIKLEDIAVIDQDGVALTKTRSGSDDNSSQGRLDLQRDVDSYLEGKLRRLLAHVDPQGEFSVSVDATLRLDEVKVTTEDVLPASDPAGGKQTGVLIRERQTQRSEVPPTLNEPSASASAPQSASTTREVEYKVGHRIEQIATAPGGIERISVAVIGHTSSSTADMQSIRDLVMHAIGASEERGDSIAVVLLPVDASASRNSKLELIEPTTSRFKPLGQALSGGNGNTVKLLVWLLGAALAVVVIWMLFTRRNGRAPAGQGHDVSAEELDRIVEKVNTWLNKAPSHGAH